MNAGPDKPAGDLRRWMFAAYVGLMILGAAVACLVFFTNVFDKSTLASILQFIWVVIAFVVIAMLSKLLKILDVLQENSTKLERMIEAFEKSRSILERIDEGIRLSDAARAVLYRDADRQCLREAVLEKLRQQGIEAAQKLIDEIGRRAGYEEFAEQLGQEVSSHQDATTQEQITQTMADIDKLLETHEWARASVQIEKSIGAYPQSTETKALRQKLAEKMEARKKVLLTVWDDAVQRGATDRSLEILKELDQYLTPNEGLALQQAARDVFKNKLHNLGVQFSLAVSSRNWAQAVEVGEQITRDFPNSKMADEIREKMDLLKQKIGQTGM
ncbi:MAG TPA: hypothetical protein VMX13_04785 [Sedimentisphaerales bacterium]|nr:hypothetical protein [Sedimentisphaerales bacterium]